MHICPFECLLYSRLPILAQREGGGGVDVCAILHTTVLSPGYGWWTCVCTILPGPPRCVWRTRWCLPPLTCVSLWMRMEDQCVCTILPGNQDVWRTRWCLPPLPCVSLYWLHSTTVLSPGCGWRTSVCVPSSLAIKMCGGQDRACLPCLASHHVLCTVDTGTPHSQLIFQY